MKLKQTLFKIIKMILSILKKLYKKMKYYHYIIIIICVIIGGYYLISQKVENFAINDEDLTLCISFLSQSKISNKEADKKFCQSRIDSIKNNAPEILEYDIQDSDIQCVREEVKKSISRGGKKTEDGMRKEIENIQGKCVMQKQSKLIKDNKKLKSTVQMISKEKRNVEEKYELLQEENSTLEGDLKSEKDKWFFERWF